jgi:hypothetical protein
MTIPLSPLSPGDEPYQEMLDTWTRLGYPREMDFPELGQWWQVSKPNQEPVFNLMLLASDIGVELSKRDTWQGRYDLPIIDQE